MKIEIADELLAGTNLNEEQLRLELAIHLYQKNILSLETAAKFAGIDSYLFQKQLGANKIPIHYTIQDLEDDIRLVNEL
jgi:predicted HTH domain antitoxin